MSEPVRAGPCATIDLAALRANAGLARRCAQGRALMAVVKADAYGHGAVPVARELLAAGADGLIVLTADEVAELRDGGVAAPLLALGGPRDAAEAEALVAHGACAVLHHEEGGRRIADVARARGVRAAVQIEVDTGMRRMGVPASEAPAFAERVRDDGALALEGVFTHFACADDPDPASALAQVALFREVLAGLAARGIDPGAVHIANSAGLLTRALVEALPEATAVRPGLMLYGVRPAPHLPLVSSVSSASAGGRGGGEGGAPRPVMTLRAPVVCIRQVKRGESVGYGSTFVAARDTRIATLALGYADGLSWRAGGRGRVWLAGALRPLVGRVSMDSVAVDVGTAPVALGDAAVFFGRDGEGGYAVEDAATDAETLAYELLVRVGRRVHRRFVNANAPSR